MWLGQVWVNALRTPIATGHCDCHSHINHREWGQEKQKAYLPQTKATVVFSIYLLYRP